MVHDQVYVPLRKEFKTGSFGEDHPQYRMRLFQPALLPALHRIAIINAGTLYSGHAGFQSIRITEFGAAVSQNAFKNRGELVGAHTLFQTIKNKTDSAFGAAVHQECKKQLFSYKKHGQQSFLRLSRRMDGIHFNMRGKIQGAKIAVKSAGKDSSVRDLCFVAFPWLKTGFPLQIDIPCGKKGCGQTYLIPDDLSGYDKAAVLVRSTGK